MLIDGGCCVQEEELDINYFYQRTPLFLLLCSLRVDMVDLLYPLLDWDDLKEVLDHLLNELHNLFLYIWCLR